MTSAELKNHKRHPIYHPHVSEQLGVFLQIFQKKINPDVMAPHCIIVPMVNT